LIGWRQALGQLAFGLLRRLVQLRSAQWLGAIWHAHALNPEPPRSGWQEIGSVNAPVCRQALRQFRPDVVVVYGTRIIRWRTLGALAAPFINCHAGINPKYRGQNGAYWARSRADDAHAGVTVHLVDEGVDTGAVLYQAKVFARDDNNRYLPAPAAGRGLAAVDQGRGGCAGRATAASARKPALAAVVSPDAVGLSEDRASHPRLV